MADVVTAPLCVVSLSYCPARSLIFKRAGREDHPDVLRAHSGGLQAPLEVRRGEPGFLQVSFVFFVFFFIDCSRLLVLLLLSRFRDSLCVSQREGCCRRVLLPVLKRRRRESLLTSSELGECRHALCFLFLPISLSPSPLEIRLPCPVNNGPTQKKKVIKMEGAQMSG